MRTYFVNPLILLTLLLLAPVPLPAQEYFQKMYGHFGDIMAGEVLEMNDGGFLVSGLFRDSASTDYDVFMAKADAHGNGLWAQSYLGVGDAEIKFMMATTDSGIVGCGYAGGYGAGGREALLMKTDTLGNLLWAKAYGGAGNEWMWKCIELPAGNGYALSGSTTSWGQGGYDGFFIRTSVTGQFYWARVFGGSGDEDMHEMIRTPDEGYLWIGGTESFGAGDRDLILIRLDKGANVIWAKTYGGAAYDGGGTNLIEHPDGGFLIPGYTKSFSPDSTVKAMLLKIDSVGNLLWSKVYDVDNLCYFNFIYDAGDGNYYLVGSSSKTDLDNADVWIMKVDPEGNMIWSNSYPMDNRQTALGGLVALQDGFMQAGTHQNTAGDYDLRVIRGDANGSTGCYEAHARIELVPHIVTVAPAAVVRTAITPSAPIANFTSSGDIIMNQDLLCNGFSCGKDGFEPNNRKQTARDLHGGAIMGFGNMRICPATDVDWFYVKLDRITNRFSVTLSSLPADYNLEVYRPDGSVGTHTQSGTNAESVVTYNAQPGIYYMKVYGVDGAWSSMDAYSLIANTTAYYPFPVVVPVKPEEGLPFERLAPDHGPGLYPNPAQGEVNIQFYSGSSGNIQIRMLDITGKGVLHTSRRIMSGENTLLLTFGDLPAGIYFLIMNDGVYEWREKVLVE